MTEVRTHRDRYPKLMTAKEVADVLRVDLSTVYRWISGGELGALQFGGRGHTVRIPSSEVVRLASSPPTGPVDEAAPA